MNSNSEFECLFIPFESVAFNWDAIRRSAEYSKVKIIGKTGSIAGLIKSLGWFEALGNDYFDWACY